ncbi:MAG: hypothetical protein PHO20_05735, partial [Candidatus Peribacteraceae bacterium]|nr:hypothetical protein [Candidatus Peribacteraceae bacterium]
PFPPSLMAKKTRTKKKSTKVTKRKMKIVKKVGKVKKVTKARKVKKAKAKATKKITVAKKKLVAKIAEQVIGKVTHYYDHIGVAVIAVNETIRLGDTIRLKHGNHIFEQKVESLQVNHTPITSAAKGQEVGMKVDEVADEGTLILPV